MSASMRDRLKGVHPQMLKARSEGAPIASETDPQNLADLRAVIGQLVERAIQLMGLTKQQAAYEMGYSDQGVVSRWCTATERPLFDKLFALDGFEVAWVIAIAERNRQRIDVATIVTIKRSA